MIQYSQTSRNNNQTWISNFSHTKCGFFYRPSLHSIIELYLRLVLRESNRYSIPQPTRTTRLCNKNDKKHVQHIGERIYMWADIQRGTCFIFHENICQGQKRNFSSVCWFRECRNIKLKQISLRVYIYKKKSCVSVSGAFRKVLWNNNWWMGAHFNRVLFFKRRIQNNDLVKIIVIFKLTFLRQLLLTHIKVVFINRYDTYLIRYTKESFFFFY